MNAQAIDWPQQLFEEFKNLDIRQVAYVPDAGHSKLITLVRGCALTFTRCL